MNIRDGRTSAQRKTHTYIVVGTDKFMSGQGYAKGGKSYAGWACVGDVVDRVERWVRNRSDMTRVRLVDGNYRPRGPGDFRIYVVDEHHPALISWLVEVSRNV